MKHVVLAAGKGIRCLPLTTYQSKIVLDLGDGTTLLDHKIKLTQLSQQIDETIVVTGFHRDGIQSRVNKKFSDHNVRCVFNPNFEINNPLYSLHTVSNELLSFDTIISNGDTYISAKQAQSLVSDRSEGVTLVISQRKPQRKDRQKVVSVSINKDSSVSDIQNSVDIGSHKYESVGMVTVCGVIARKVFSASVDYLIKKHGKTPHYWHDTLNIVKKQIPVRALVIPKTSWHEIDTAADLEELQHRLQTETAG